MRPSLRQFCDDEGTGARRCLRSPRPLARRPDVVAVRSGAGPPSESLATVTAGGSSGAVLRAAAGDPAHKAQQRRRPTGSDRLDRKTGSITDRRRRRHRRRLGAAAAAAVAG